MIKPDPKPKKRTRQKRSLDRDLAQAVFIRDEYVCQYCFRMFPPINDPLDCSLHAHHIVHKSQGGKDTMENLNTACWACHGNHGRITRIDRERALKI